jgi:hypothetical protein
MATITDPSIDNWYKDVENNLTFKVIAIEDNGDVIEVQYLDGDLSSYDKESWYNSTFDYIEAPEDWSAPYDDMEDDDLGYSDLDTHRRNFDDISVDDWIDD